MTYKRQTLISYTTSYEIGAHSVHCNSNKKLSAASKTRLIFCHNEEHFEIKV